MALYTKKPEDEKGALCTGTVIAANATESLSIRVAASTCSPRRRYHAATPPMTYEPETVWSIDNGFCGRWYCTVSMPDGSTTRMRGFDLVEFDGDRIGWNEVYVHPRP